MYKKKLLFDINVRGLYDKKTNKIYFSILDIIRGFTNAKNPREYWNKLKKKLIYENSKVIKEIKYMKLPNKKGKHKVNEVLNIEGILRIILMLPSSKAEMFRTKILDIIKSNLFFYMTPSEIIRNIINDYEKYKYYNNKLINKLCGYIEITWLKNC